jgi:hypothetical protein
MAAFTEITNGFAPQLNMAEIVNAANERRLAAIASGATGLPDAIPTASPQSFQGGAVKPTHLLIQEMLEALAPKFVDHTQSGYTDSSSTAPISAFTVSTWRSVAGINSSGFRRVTEWDDPSEIPEFSYGNIQTGDIAGFWIWADLVKGIKALKWTVALTGKTASARRTQESISADEGSSFSQAVSFFDSEYAAQSWISAYNFFADPRRTDVRIYSGGLGGYEGYARMIRDKHYRSFSSAAPTMPIPVTAVFVARPTRGDNDSFYDPDGLSQDTWVELETVDADADSSSVTMTDYSISSSVNNPFYASGVQPNTKYGSVSNLFVVLKWGFSLT